MESVVKKRKFREVNKNVPLPVRENEVNKRFRGSTSKENPKIFKDGKLSSKKPIKNVKNSHDEKNDSSSIFDQGIDSCTCNGITSLSTCNESSEISCTCYDKSDKFYPCDDNEEILQLVEASESSSKLSTSSDRKTDSYEDDFEDDFDKTLKPDEYSSDSTLKSALDTIEDEDSTAEATTEDESSVSEASMKAKFIISDTESRENRLWFSHEYIEDIILNELHKENVLPCISKMYCKQYDINPDRRETLVDWLIDLHRVMKIGNAMIHVAVALLDTLLDSIPVPVEELQTAAAAAFWVAYKFFHGNLELKYLIKVSSGSVTKQNLLRYELLILQHSSALQSGSDILVFFNYFLYRIFGYVFPHEIYYCGQYLLEIMLLHTKFVQLTNFEKAISAVYVTDRYIFKSQSPSGSSKIFKVIKEKRLLEISHHILEIVVAMYENENSLQDCAVYKKYGSSKRFRISSHENFKKLVAMQRRSKSKLDLDDSSDSD